ncbi:unnamed protein product (macronuclear) [Paramecium tetraurelia]|uniref:HTH bat-type domain-containing protein n=1 Tax=Paramecium tetraurelia TaxID=5888 RepID=A0D1V8_PARTE|nr:uncharacterized protein GSPATT00012550001 [Paramecium tetraurelia]CAK77025.1 unnamed protein product [Paramecium tetraurelia]|eukprot:XP_001444422.1 hypothetical protein (macronuclear) [Paramecium tetraurelia strain d4-2]
MSDNSSEENSTSSREINMQQMSIKLYVEMIDAKDNSSTYIEYFPSFDLGKMIQPNGINIFKLTHKLKELGIQLEGRTIAYYSYDCEMYINCGMDPVHCSYVIPFEEIKLNNQLRIKCLQTAISLIHLVMSEEMNEKVNKMKEQDGNDQQNLQQQGQENQKQCRRTKERRIGYIIEKVSKWREYYSGIMIDGESKRFTLEEAAQKVNISKKSLDDYLLQIRYGRKFGFNFNEHKNEKVGVLRAFVKKNNCTKKKKIKTE